MNMFQAAAGWSAWPAPAKLNLFLQIVGRRPDGYHELQTVFRLLDWGDTVFVRPRADGVIARIGEGANGVAEADDLAIHAAKIIKEDANCTQGADIGVEKRIPIGGGFGGGSSDAATVLVALNHLWGLGFRADRLAALGLQLGADVPVFVHGRNAWAEGIGERLAAIELPPAWYVLASPGVQAATAGLFQAPDLTRNAAPAKMSGYLPEIALGNAAFGNAFEPVLRRREPAVEALFATLAQVGVPRLTGSGSGCFVEFATRESAQAALAALPSGVHAWLARGVERSPLLDAVEGFNTGASPSG